MKSVKSSLHHKTTTSHFLATANAASEIKTQYTSHSIKPNGRHFENDKISFRILK
jgi:hypothetical protein